MEIGASSIAARAYGSARAATGPAPERAATTARQMAGDFAEALSRTEDTAKAALTGNADPHALVTALAETELAVETAVTVRDRVVEAYQQILRMPV